MEKNSLNFENLAANVFKTKSLKKKFANMYNKVAPNVVEVKTIKIPHHFPNTNPANNRSGVAKPKRRTQIMQKIKKLNINKKRLLFL